MKSAGDATARPLHHHSKVEETMRVFMISFIAALVTFRVLRHRRERR